MAATRELVAFLNARLAEDIQTGAWSARVRREVEAKRLIVAEHSDGDSDWCHTCESGTGHCRTLGFLAAIWRDHPDYAHAWDPSN
jgi:Family of unknown function (DUF6221)